MAVADDLARELDALVTRLRGFTPTRYAAGAPPFATRGEAAWHLARELAARARAAEGLPAYPLPRLGDHGLADQIAVIGHDLLAALAARPQPELAAEALGEVALHRRDLDGAPPGRATVAALAAAWGLEPATGPVLLAAAARCPALEPR